MIIFFKEKASLNKDGKPIIVDGCALLWSLTNRAPGRNYGGDYDRQYDELDNFFKEVGRMGIKMFVLIDGGMNVPLKRKTNLERRNQQVKSMVEYNEEPLNYDGKLPQSLFTRAQLNEVLAANNIPSVTCDEEADLYVASICKQKNGIAATNDSDFLVIDIPNGVVRIEDLLYSIDNKKPFVPLFKRHYLESYLKIDAAFLPYLALVLGNDYSDYQILSKVKTRLGIPSGKLNFDAKIEKFKQFFTNQIFQSDEDTLRDLCCEENDGQDRMISQLRKEIEEYRVDRLHESSQPLLETLDRAKTMNEIVENRRDCPTTTVLEYVTELMREGFLDSTIYDIVKYRVNFLSVQVGCIQQSSPSTCSIGLRKHLYSILFRQEEGQVTLSDQPHISPFRQVEVTEYARRDRNYTAKTLTVAPTGPSIFELLDQPVEDRRLYILRLLESPEIIERLTKATAQGAETVNKSSILFLIALKYLHSIREVFDHQIEAFLVMHVFCQRKSTTVLFDYNTAPPEIDIPLIHLFSSFHSVFYHFSIMNALLGNPFETLGSRHLMSGSLFLHTCKRLLKNKKYEKIMAPEEVEELRRIQKFINPALFEKGQISNDMSSSNSRSRDASRQGGAQWQKKDGAPANTRRKPTENEEASRKRTKPSVSSNRFAGLSMSDDSDDSDHSA